MNDKFKIKRADGRSNTQVILDIVKDKNPGDIVSYDAVAAELSIGATKPFTRAATQGAVRRAMPAIGKLYKRTLDNVTAVGYRVAKADEHMHLACRRQDKAHRQLKRGLEILRDTRLDEIKDDVARAAHEGHMLVTAAILQQTQQLDRRMSKIESAIASLKVSKEQTA